MRVTTLGVAICGVLAAYTPAAAQNVHIDLDLGELHRQLAAEFELALQNTDGERQRREAERQREAVEAQRREAERQRQAFEAQRRVFEQQRRGAFGGSEYTENFARTVRLGRTGMFELSNIAGDITITGGGGEDVRVQAVKRVRRQNENDARALLRDVDIQVTERSGLVEVRTELPSRRDVAAAVDYTIALPSGASVGVRTVSGNVRVSNVKGELRAESISGDVNASAIGRLRAMKSVSGNIDISDADAEDIVANTVNGDVIVRNLKARSMDLESVSGNLRFSDTQCDRVSLKTISGDIDYAGRLARSGRYEMQSHSGDVRITPIGNAAFDLEANTFSGDVRSDFPLTLRGAVGNNLTAGPGPRFNRTVRGTLGDGGAMLSIRSFSGDIAIVKR